MLHDFLLSQGLPIAIVFFAAGVVQATAGFGYALLATPLLLWLGVPLPHTMAMVAVTTFAQTAVGARHLRAEIPWRTVGAATVVRVAMTAAGVLVLRRMARLDLSDVRFVVGLIVAVLVLAQLLWRPHPHEHLHPAWGVASFTASGFLSGLCGMSGPPLVLWTMAQPWSSHKSRGFLFASFMVTQPVQIALVYLALGPAVLEGCAKGLILAPAAALGTLVGLPIGNRLAKPRLQMVVYALLMIVALNAIVPRLWSLLAP